MPLYEIRGVRIQADNPQAALSQYNTQHHIPPRSPLGVAARQQLRRELVKDLRQLGEPKHQAAADALMEAYPDAKDTKPLVGKYFSAKSKPAPKKPSSPDLPSWARNLPPLEDIGKE